MSYVLQFQGSAINGDTHGLYYPRLQALACRTGWTLNEPRDLVRVPGTSLLGLGLTDFMTKQIQVSAILPPNMRVRVLAHELGHAFTGRPDLVWPYAPPQKLHTFSEVVAEGVALRVCAGIGLNTMDVSAEYLQQLPQDLVRYAINKECGRVVQIADRILSELN
jgi:hypothetical protein